MVGDYGWKEKNIVGNMIIGIDFDGTCVTHDYPRIGKDIGAVEVLLALANKGHKFVLNTMRSGKELQDAVDWFKEHDIPLYGVNENPTQRRWTTSPKVYAHLYIDDAALGCPLKTNFELSERPFVDWEMIKFLMSDYSED